MPNITVLFNAKYILLDYIYHNATIKDGVYVLYDTIDEMVEKLPFQRRKVFNELGRLEEEGFLEKYQFNRRKYAFTEKGLNIYIHLHSVVEELTTNKEQQVLD